MKQELKFGCEDPWLLLSIIYADQQGNYDLTSIIGYGDFINHAIFSLEELQGGLYRLIESGYVVEKDMKFLPTDKIIVPYKKFRKNRNSVQNDIEFIRKELNAPEWTSDYDPSKANDDGIYKKITKAVVVKAYENYKKSMKTD